MLLAVVGILLGGGSGTLVYELAKAPVHLMVTDGSMIGVIEGNFANVSSLSPLVGHFTTTTYANQSSGTGSTLALRLNTSTFFIPGYNLVETDIKVTVQGVFASNLNLSGLTVTYNQTGQLAAARGGALSSRTNVSYDPVQIANVTGPGSAVLTPALLNQSATAPFYEFVFPSFFMTWYPVGHDHFLGFRVTVAGRFTPAVGVGILLKLMDVPGGVWG